MGYQAARPFGQMIAGNDKIVRASPKVTDMTLGDIHDAVTGTTASQTITVQLHWTEYVQGVWTARESGGVDKNAGTMTVSGVTGFDPADVFVHVSKEPTDDGQERGVYVHLSGPINRSFYLAGRNSLPESVPYGTEGPQPQNPYNAIRASGTRYHGAGPLTVEFKRRIATTDGGAPVDAVETPAILGNGGAYTLLPCDNDITLGQGGAEIATLAKPVFYQDSGATFFVEPSVSEQTIEDWQEWVTRTPRPDPGWTEPHPWGDVHVKPQVPRPYRPVPVDPHDPLWHVDVDPAAAFSVAPGNDWLVNPGTAVLFGDQVIAPAGRAAQLSVTSAATAAMVAAGPDAIAVTVNVGTGSGLPSGAVLLAAHGGALTEAELAPSTAGLTVVGGAGIGAAARHLVGIGG